VKAAHAISYHLFGKGVSDVKKIKMDLTFASKVMKE
jgi:hypothetical protein